MNFSFVKNIYFDKNNSASMTKKKNKATCHSDVKVKETFI